MYKKTLYATMTVSLLGATCSTWAGITFGDPQSDTGAITISGTVRANYQDKEYGMAVSDQKIQFDTAILRLDYESPKVFANTQYRCYQYAELCDFATLVDAYVGYRFNKTDSITIGLQPIPFGIGQFWDSSFYAGINNTMGLQDVHNLGAKYQFIPTSSTKIEFAYFATDGGHYQGDSKDAARFTANMVKSAEPLKTDLKEKNMWMGRIGQDVIKTDDLSLSVGGSYWYADVENKQNAQKGSRNTWALFGQFGYQNLRIAATGGELSINNKDPLNPFSTFGSFDTEYDLANKGYFYTLDSSYSFNEVMNGISVTPYLVLSGFNKKQQNFNDSVRHIAGIMFGYKNAYLYTEYIMAKNDPFVGGNRDSLTQGDDNKWNKLLNLTFIYNF